MTANGESGNQPKEKKGFHESQDMKKTIALLSYLHENNYIKKCDINELFISQNLTESPQEKIDYLVENLRTLPVKIYGDTLFWAGPLDDYAVGRRLHKSYESKVLLAKKTVDCLISQKPFISSIFIGAGSSAFAVTQELIKRRDQINTLEDIYTNNVLALHELLPYGNLFRIRLPDGRIIIEDGTIISEKGLKSLRDENFDATIVSFLGMNYEKGFSSDGNRDKEEKMMNLRLNSSVTYLLLCWEKFGSTGELVTTVGEGIDKNKKYVIITDPPNNWENNDPDKVKEFAKWHEYIEKGIIKFEFLYK